MPKKTPMPITTQEESITLLDATYQFDNFGFTNSLPIPGEIDATKHTHLVLEMRQSEVNMGIYSEPVNPDDAVALTTTVWGYSQPQGTPGYLGPTILAEEGTPVTVVWKNMLPTDNPLGHLLHVDYTLHRANPSLKGIEDGYIPVVPHLHGGANRSQFDGIPEAWWTQIRGPAGQHGEKFAGNIYTYDNDQQAAPLWYHDHALGITRLNVYAGLAGVYDLTDDNERQLKADDILPQVEVPLVIQDKAFTSDGQLYYPALENDPLPDAHGGSGSVGEELAGTTFFEDNPDAASALPEFFGDHILVNGVAWPNVNVSNDEEHSAYTFKLLNGSDSRFYVLDFVQVDDGKVTNPDPISVFAVAGDGGLLPKAVDVSGGFVLAPGDRLDVVLDFRDLDDGTTIRLVNSGPLESPFKGFVDPGDSDSLRADVLGSGLLDATPADPGDPRGNIMQFTVAPDAPDVINGDDNIALSESTELNVWEAPDYTDAVTRKVGLFEGTDTYGRVQPLLGTAKEGLIHVYNDDGTVQDLNQFGPLLWDDPTTETPEVGTTERWQIFNFTADAHPVHLHLTQFEALARHEIQYQDVNGDGIPDDTNDDNMISYGCYTDAAADIDFGAADIWISTASQWIAPEEGGRQDTVYVQSGPPGMGVEDANIGQMLEIAAYFANEGPYVWHCHILSHEDHEMMRELEVQPEGSGPGNFVDDAAFMA